MPRLAEVVSQIHEWYPPATAEDWDAVGLVYGDPEQSVKKVMFAVDPSPAVAEEAADWKADLLVVHHPLFLKPVHGFAATTPKGRTLATLARAECARSPHTRTPTTPRAASPRPSLWRSA